MGMMPMPRPDVACRRGVRLVHSRAISRYPGATMSTVSKPSRAAKDLAKQPPCSNGDAAAPRSLPGDITDAQTMQEDYLRQIFVRAQMSDFVRDPLVMARADGLYYWDVQGKQYLDALSGIYTANVGHNNRRVIEAIK